MSGPPDKFIYLDLTGTSAGSDTATALTTAYSNFLSQFGVYPTVAITVGNYVYLGAY